MPTSKPMFSKPTTPSVDDFSKELLRASNTEVILRSALHFGCHLVGICEKDSRFPSSSSQAPKGLFLFAEGKIDNWEVSWLIMAHSKHGNKFGYAGCSPLIQYEYIQGIYVYDGSEWHKSPPL